MSSSLPQDLANRSLVKYLLIVEEFGGWEALQQLLRVLHSVADGHSPLTGQDGSIVDPVSIAMVAIQYIRSREEVGGVIIGAHNEKYVVYIYKK